MDYTQELEFAKSLAFKAGEMMLAGFSNSSITVKENLTPVTETDLAISKMVIDAVKKEHPNHVVFDEELQHASRDQEYIWVCDPIDGTVPFAHHIPTSMFSLALCKNGEPVVAVIYDPYMKRMLYTAEGIKSFMNDKEIHVLDRGFQKGDYIYGAAYHNKNLNYYEFSSLLHQKYLNNSYVESFVYIGMLVALGLTPVQLTTAANPWDRAAVMMIIRNAGGMCTDEHGDPITVFGNPKLFIATNSIVHKEVMELVQKCYK